MYYLACNTLQLFVAAFVHDLSTQGVASNTEWQSAKDHMKQTTATTYQEERAATAEQQNRLSNSNLTRDL